MNTRIIQSGLEDLSRITKADFFLCDSLLEPIASTFENLNIDSLEIEREIIQNFSTAEADGQNVKGYEFLKIRKSDDEFYILITFAKGKDGYMLSKIAASEVSHLMSIENIKTTKDEFYKDLLYDNVLLGEIRTQSEKLKIKDSIARRVIAINIPEKVHEASLEIVRNMYYDEKNDYAVLIGDNIVLVKEFEGLEDEEAADTVAGQIVSMMNTELMIKAKATYGKVIHELRELSESYKEAVMAMEVMTIFYDEKEVASYKSLGIGRLIHQLPKELCEMFLEEVFGTKKGPEISDENMHIIDSLFKNNLNVSETARDLDIKRTTLIYKIEKISKLLNLDICNFEDAITLKIAMMVAKFINSKR